MTPDNPVVNLAKVSPSQVVVFNDYPYFKPRTKSQRTNEKNLTRGKYNGFMSHKSKKKITERVEVWINGVNAILKTKRESRKATKPYFTFVTLTLPSEQTHSDKEIKRHCLNTFIIWMTKVKEVKYYYWVAEKQKNGNIHFHIIIDKFIDWQQIKKEWNNCLNKLEYINRYSEKMSKYSFNDYWNLRGSTFKGTKQSLVKIFKTQQKTGWTTPNSTDIHKLINLNNPASYITKYLTKGNEVLPIDGRLSGCSDKVKDLKQSSFVIEGKLWHEIQKMKKDNRVKKHYDEFFGCFYLNKNVDLKKDYPYLYHKMIVDNIQSMKRMYSKEKVVPDKEEIEKLEEKALKKGKEGIQQNMFGKNEMLKMTENKKWKKR